MKQGQDGQSVLEVMVLGVLLLVPLIWLLGVLADMHRSALAASAAAREVGFELSQGGAVSEVDELVARAFFDHGADPGRARASWSTGGAERGARVEVLIRYPVPLLQAPILGSIDGLDLWIEARHVAHVQRYASRD